MKWNFIINLITSVSCLLKLYFKYKIITSASNIENSLKEKIEYYEKQINSYYIKIREAKTVQEAQNYLYKRDELVSKLVEVRKDLKRLTGIK